MIFLRSTATEKNSPFKVIGLYRRQDIMVVGPIKPDHSRGDWRRFRFGLALKELQPVILRWHGCVLPKVLEGKVI